MNTQEGHSHLQLGQTVVNLSSRSLNSSEHSLLDKGLKFIPTPQNTTHKSLKNPVKSFGRKLAITHFFHNKNLRGEKLPFIPKSTWTPPSALTPDPILKKIKDIFKEVSGLKIPKEIDNLPQDEISAINTLKNDNSIIIKKSDKGSATVILDKKDYIWECERQLSNTGHYKKLDQPLYPQTSLEVSSIVQKLKDLKYITKKQFEYLNPPEDPRPRHLYTLPKIHKPPDKWSVPFKIPPGRPIISDCSSESYAVSEYIDHFLAPLSIRHPAYLKDTNDFIHKIRKVKIPTDSLLISLDVDSMYTNIDNKAGLKAVKESFDLYPDPKRPDLEILELLKISLEKNDFEFNGDWFLQVSGTAMGKKFAPSYANIFMAAWEREVFTKCPSHPITYLRYLDDIFIIWTKSKQEFEEYFEILNNHHPAVKLKATISENSIDFLDTTVFKGPDFSVTGQLDTKVFFKPTDTHQLLHKKSFHPKHTFKGLIKSQILRFKRISSLQSDLQKTINILFRALRRRGYSNRFLRKIKNETLYPKETSGHSASPCNSGRCGTCPHFPHSDSFICTNSNKTYPIKNNLSCHSKNVIYLITCSRCGIQYVGQTSLTLRDRFTRHRFDINHKLDKPVSNHFNGFNHSISDCQIVPIEQVSNQDNLLHREQFWINTLKTVHPEGLNLQNDINQIIPFIIPFNTAATRAAKITRHHYSELQALYPQVFKSNLVTAYCRNKNLTDHLIRSRLK